MNGTYISAFAHSTVIELSQENKVLFEMLGEFAENCELEGRPAVKLNGNSIESGDCCGFIRLVDGTLIEILPNVQSDDVNAARENLCRSFCSRIGYGFGDSRLSESANFMEYFISVFAAESMKIIKKRSSFGISDTRGEHDVSSGDDNVCREYAKKSHPPRKALCAARGFQS